MRSPWRLLRAQREAALKGSAGRTTSSRDTFLYPRGVDEGEQAPQADPHAHLTQARRALAALLERALTRQLRLVPAGGARGAVAAHHRRAHSPPPPAGALQLRSCRMVVLFSGSRRLTRTALCPRRRLATTLTCPRACGASTSATRTSRTSRAMRLRPPMQRRALLQTQMPLPSPHARSRRCRFGVVMHEEAAATDPAAASATPALLSAQPQGSAPAAEVLRRVFPRDHPGVGAMAGWLAEEGVHTAAQLGALLAGGGAQGGAAALRHIGFRPEWAAATAAGFARAAAAAEQTASS